MVICCTWHLPIVLDLLPMPYALWPKGSFCSFPNAYSMSFIPPYLGCAICILFLGHTLFLTAQNPTHLSKFNKHQFLHVFLIFIFNYTLLHESMALLGEITKTYWHSLYFSLFIKHVRVWETLEPEGLVC